MVRTNDEESGRRVKRLLQIMFLLQETEARSSGHLAKLFKVSRRTIFRDIQLLREAGIPITPGTNGTGYCLRAMSLRGVQLRPMELIAMACADPRIPDFAFLRDARQIALAKLAGSSAEFTKAQMQFVVDHLAELEVNGKPGLQEEGAIEALVESWIKTAKQLKEK